MAKILDKIPSMTDKDLLTLFNNAHNLLDNSQSKDAIAVIDKIQVVWFERLQLAKKGKYKATSPDIGMLKSFQYAVGNDGLSQKKRQNILNMIFNSDLPVVGSPAYTLEWGEKKSKKRYYKINRTLNSLLSSATSNKREGWEKAVIEWREDIEYIENNLKKLISSND